MPLSHYWHSIRHTQPDQLIARLRLMMRRKWRERRAGSYRQAHLRRELPPLYTSQSLPQPVFPPRTGMVKTEGDELLFTFLSETRRYSIPVDWHDRALNHGTRLWKLNLHYMEFLEELPDELFSRVVADWIDGNPPYAPGYWLDNWNSYALSIRCVVWMQEFSRRGLDQLAEVREAMLISLVRQIRFLEENLELDIGGNHLIKNIKALLWASCFFDIPDVDRWRRLGEDLLEKELDAQILEDGFHYELSPAYHTQVFADLIECHTVLEDGPLRTRLGSVLNQMAQVLVDVREPDGDVALFNDAGLNMTYSPGTVLDACAAILGRAQEQRSVIRLDSAGYYGLRVDDEYFLADYGRVGPDNLPAHAHGDIFSYVWCVARKRLVIDTGVFEYNSGDRREYSRSTRAHNTVTIDGQDQCEFWGSFRVARRASVLDRSFTAEGDEIHVAAEHDGYERLSGRPVHRRHIHAKPGSVTVEDDIKGGAGQKVESRILIHPDWQVREEGGDVVIFDRQATVRLTTKARIQIGRAPWYPDFGVEIETTRLVLEYGTAPCSMSYSLERQRRSCQSTDGPGSRISQAV